MTGLEMMFSKMIGLSPDQLKEMANQFVTTVQNIDERLKDIQKKVTEIHSVTVSDEPLKEPDQND